MTNDEYFWLGAQAFGVCGMILVTATLYVLRTKERRKKEREASGPLTPPATPAPDRPDWHGAPASKPR